MSTEVKSSREHYGYVETSTAVIPTHPGSPRFLGNLATLGRGVMLQSGHYFLPFDTVLAVSARALVLVLLIPEHILVLDSGDYVTQWNSRLDSTPSFQASQVKILLMIYLA